MKLGIAALCSLILGAFAAALAWQFLPPVPISASPAPSLIDATELGRVATASIAGMASYAVCAGLLVTVEFLFGLNSARNRLTFLDLREDLSATNWYGAFSGTIIEPLQYRVIVRSSTANGDRLILATSFSPRAARVETQAFYRRLFAVMQIWTVAVALIVLTVFSQLPILPIDTHQMVAELAAIADIILFVSLTLCWVAMVVAADRLITAICQLPLAIESSLPAKLVPTLIDNSYAALARFPAEALGVIRREVDGIARRLEQAGSQTIATDQETLQRLVTSITAGIVASIDKRISSSLRAAEKLILTSRAATQDLAMRLAALPEQLARSYAAEREDTKAMLVNWAAAFRASLEEGLTAFRQVSTEIGVQQVEQLSRSSNESREANERLTAAVASACATIEQDRIAAYTKYAQLTEIIEAYTARLLPAIKRLETSDDRLLRSIGQQDDTLGRLALVVSELSGTLEAMQMTLGYTMSKSTAIAGPQPMPSLQEVPAPSIPDAANFKQELQALLNEIEGTTKP